MSAIVAALVVAVASSVALTGCGQTGRLYLPTVPPLPPKPSAQTETPPENAASSPDASAPLTLSPAGELAASSPRADRPSPASAASSSAPDQ
jgi:predicted small lipoprotein YifL